VAQRNREIALRMAVGATSDRVLRMVMGSSLRTVALGAVCGLGAALAVSRVLTSMLYGIGAGDPITYAAVVAFFGLVALVASALPALRASRIDPMSALRSE
jgi:ABC-type antimicrobial peptide transport system permease subunit